MTTITAPTTPAGVLHAAADWLEQDPSRWGPDFFIAPDTGCRCTLGALAAVVRIDDADGDPWFVLGDEEDSRPGRGAATALARYLVDERGEPDQFALQIDRRVAVTNIVGDWNDAPGRTCAQVVELLRAAAEHAGGAR